MCKEDLEVHGTGPLCGVGLDVELGTGPVDLGHDDLDWECGTLGWLLVPAILEHKPLSVIPGTLGHNLWWG